MQNFIPWPVKIPEIYESLASSAKHSVAAFALLPGDYQSARLVEKMVWNLTLCDGRMEEIIQDLCVKQVASFYDENNALLQMHPELRC